MRSMSLQKHEEAESHGQRGRESGHGVRGAQVRLPGDSAQMIGSDYMTVVCVEGPAFYVMHGTARIGKDCGPGIGG